MHEPIPHPSTSTRDRARPHDHGLHLAQRLLATCSSPPNVYWVEQMEIMRYSAHPTTSLLFFNRRLILLLLLL